MLIGVIEVDELEEVNVSAAEENKASNGRLSSATLRFFSFAEQCHTQNFYLRCFKSDLDAVKGKFGLLIE